MPKRSRSRSPPGDNKNIIRMLKKLERRMDSLEKHKRRSIDTSSSSDYDSALERRHRRGVKGRIIYTSDTSSDRVSNEGNLYFFFSYLLLILFFINGRYRDVLPVA